MDAHRFGSTSRRLVVELVVVVAASFHARLPKGASYVEGWRYVGRNAELIVHVGVGVVALAEAAALAVGCLRAGRRPWSVLALAGAVLVLLAAVSGDRFVATQRTTAVDLMGVAWFAALVTYGIGWRLGSREQAAALRR